MRSALYLALVCWLFTSCNSTGSEKMSSTDTTRAVVVQPVDTANAFDLEVDTAQFATVYMVVIETGQDYNRLSSIMHMLSSKLHIPIDTLNRYYNAVKKEVVLADNDEDEMYRGEYFPRRDASASLSIEMYKYYVDAPALEPMALVAGIYGKEGAANYALTQIKPYVAYAKVVKGKIYMGCMH